MQLMTDYIHTVIQITAFTCAMYCAQGYTKYRQRTDAVGQQSGDIKIIFIQLKIQRNVESQSVYLRFKCITDVLSTKLL